MNYSLGFFSIVMLYDETYTMYCSVFLAYSVLNKNIVSIYFLRSSSFLSGVCKAQYEDLALGHEFYYLWFFVRQIANVPGPNFFAFL